jgi:hypothetical protein
MMMAVRAASERSTSGDGERADVLLQVKDWLTNAVELLQRGRPAFDPAPLLALMRKAPASSSPAVVSGPAAPALADSAPANGPADAPASEPAPAAADLPSFSISDPGLARDFVAEAREHFDSADEGLLTL